MLREGDGVRTPPCAGGYPRHRYAKTTDGVYIAYQTVGDGPIDLVWQLDIFGNIDLIWDHPGLGRTIRSLAEFSA